MIMNRHKSVFLEKDGKGDSGMKVFLGGTCSGWKWRDELQPLLKCDYYNPMVKDWNENNRLREVHEREISDYILYAVTNGIKGVYSIAEAVDDSNKRPERTLFLNLYQEHDRYFTRQMGHSIRAVENLLKGNGVRCFDSMEAVAEFLNREQAKAGETEQGQDKIKQ